jgi:dihydrofolate reductase
MHGDEEQLFSEKWMAKGNSLLFGRITYQMMESYWTSEEAAIKDTIIAKEMNAAEKFVISTTLDKVDWEGATLLKGDLIEEVKKLKQRDKDTLYSAAAAYHPAGGYRADRPVPVYDLPAADTRRHAYIQRNKP